MGKKLLKSLRLCNELFGMVDTILQKKDITFKMSNLKVYPK